MDYKKNCLIMFSYLYVVSLTSLYLISVKDFDECYDKNRISINSIINILTFLTISKFLLIPWALYHRRLLSFTILTGSLQISFGITFIIYLYQEGYKKCSNVTEALIFLLLSNSISFILIFSTILLVLFVFMIISPCIMIVYNL